MMDLNEIVVRFSFALLATLFSVAFATDFSSCSTVDHLGITSVDFSENPIVPGSDLEITITGTPDEDISSGTLYITVYAFGVPIASDTYDLCSGVAITCPLKSGVSFTASTTQTISDSIPAIDTTIELEVKDGKTELSCIDVETSFSSTHVEGSINDETVEFLLRNQFQQYKKDFNKNYDSEEEEEMRFLHFKNSVERVAFRNTFGDNVFGLTKFSDMSQEEFSSKFLNYQPRVTKDVPVLKSKGSTPSSFDWRDEGAVTAVKNQGYCGSCWAFSIVETIESAWYIAGNEMTTFSEQQVVSCDTVDGGCNGGNTPTAYDYVQSAGGLATEEDYPYASGSDGDSLECNTNFTVSGGAISGFSYATPPCKLCYNQDEDTLAANLANVQPPSICVDASTWSDYVGGVMTSSSCSSRFLKQDHCVQLVGYTGYTGSASSSSDGYWMVRNSWDSDWGEEGYIYLQMGTNTCGLADIATTVNFD